MNESKEIERIRNQKNYDMNDLLNIMEILRSPVGCPWDREQTHASIRKCLIEETYEVCEAIDRDDAAMLREELGDLLLQVVFHARLAEEQGLFSYSDVVNDISAKMVIRHPHVFGDVQVSDTDGVLTNWDKIKMETKHQETPAQVLDSVAQTLPALMRAQKLAHKIRKYHLEQESDELTRLLGETAVSDSAKKTPGEKLFALAAECDLSDVDAEEELSALCETVVNIVKKMENRS